MKHAFASGFDVNKLGKIDHDACIKSNVTGRQRYRNNQSQKLKQKFEKNARRPGHLHGLLAEEGGLPLGDPHSGECQAIHAGSLSPFFVLPPSSFKTFGFNSARRKTKNARRTGHLHGLLAEEGGFEPPDPVKDHRFSRPVR